MLRKLVGGGISCFGYLSLLLHIKVDPTSEDVYHVSDTWVLSLTWVQTPYLWGPPVGEGEDSYI